MRIRDWSSDVCASDLKEGHSLSLAIQMLGWHRGRQIDTTSLETITQVNLAAGIEYAWEREGAVERLFTKNYLVASGNSSDLAPYKRGSALYLNAGIETQWRSEEHTSELQSLMRISYAVFCLKNKPRYSTQQNKVTINTQEH